MLEVKNLSVRYGGIQALDDISISIPDGKIVTLVGANGAGKSTTLRSIMHLVSPTNGTITWQDKDISNAQTRDIVKDGVILVPEGRHVFPDLTVLENLKIGAYLRRDREQIEKDKDFVYSVFPILKQRHYQLAGTLSGGEQQMLAVGRALMAKPKLLMMDEPSLGLAPLIIKEIFSIIERVNRESGVTVLLIEQNANAALKIADYAYVMETGRIGLEGTGEELLANERVKELYLGKAG
jgi:branched-chain amino acid transport system ATP-binding protein